MDSTFRQLCASNGSVPARYSCALLTPSPSLSNEASAGSVGLRPFASSQSSGKPSPSVSARTVITALLLKELVPARLVTATAKRNWLVVVVACRLVSARKQFVPTTTRLEIKELFIRQRKLSGSGLPSAVALNVRLPPATTDWLTGWTVTTGRIKTTSAAPLLGIEP